VQRQTRSLEPPQRSVARCPDQRVVSDIAIYKYLRFEAGMALFACREFNCEIGRPRIRSSFLRPAKRRLHHSLAALGSQNGLTPELNDSDVSTEFPASDYALRTAARPRYRANRVQSPLAACYLRCYCASLLALQRTHSSVNSTANNLRTSRPVTWS
jgi:hypothetical protein